LNQAVKLYTLALSGRVSSFPRLSYDLQDLQVEELSRICGPDDDGYVCSVACASYGYGFLVDRDESSIGSAEEFLKKAP